MALLTGLAPEKLFGLGGALGDPLRWRKNAHFRREGLSGEVAIRVTRDARFYRVGSNILLEFLQKKRMYRFRFVVRGTFLETLVESEQMARHASIREFHGRHELAPAYGLGRFESMRADRNELVIVFIAHRSRTILRIGVGQIRVYGGGAVAVATFQLNIGAIRAATNRFHVDGVVELDGAGISRWHASNGTQGGEFRMAVFEVVNLIRVV